MSLYYDAASIITSTSKNDSSLKSRVYGAKDLRSNPAQIFALLAEALKWNEVLNEVIERSDLLKEERKLTPALALLLVYDFLLAKKGIAAPASHALRTSVEKHKARLQAEFTKARLRRKCASVEALRLVLKSSGSPVGSDLTFGHPRWVRINTIKSSLKKQLDTTFAEFREVSSVIEVLRSNDSSPVNRIYYVDQNIPNLIAVPANVDLISSTAYQNGQIIFQDKASCFPAYLLNPQPEDGDVVDGCAAPGNKTTHLAALLSGSSHQVKVWACERDRTRAVTLEKMVRIAGADSVSIQAGQDFLKLDPARSPWNEVGALLLDPSCSGSGIIGREASAEFVLPSTTSSKPPKTNKSKTMVPKTVVGKIEEEEPEDIEDSDKLKERLRSLSAFQTKIVLHALKFPSAKRVAYSTCSIHDEENEQVVTAVLQSEIARKNGWRILKREEQVSGMRAWEARGSISGCGTDSMAKTIAEACIRCSKFTKDGTQGFFVAAFIRDVEQPDQEDGGSSEEWEGFED